MKKKNLTALMAALALTVVASSSLLCGNGIVSYEGEMDETGSEIAEIAPASVCTSVKMPTLVMNGVIPKIETHNCFATYEVKQNDPHGTQLEFYSNPSSSVPNYTRVVGYNETHHVLSFAGVGETECDPYPYYIKARCTTCNVVSPATAALINDKTIVNCGYKPLVVKNSGTIWTQFDLGAPGMEWSHGGLSGGTIIYYSIAYNGIVADDSLPVPKWLESSKTKEHVIDGVTFTVRVSDGYVAVKASQNVICNNLDTAFAFGVA